MLSVHFLDALSKKVFMCHKLVQKFPSFLIALKKNALFKNRKSRVVGKYFVVVINTVLFFANFIICLFFDKNTIGKY